MKLHYLKLFIVFLFAGALWTGASSLLRYSMDQIEDITPGATISSGGVYCIGKNDVDVVFTGNGGVGAGIYTFNYEINGTPAVISTNPGESTASVRYNTSTVNTTVYRLLSVSFNGGTPEAIGDQIATYRTEAAPVADFNFVDEQCSGVPVTFVNTSTNGLGVSYFWEFGDGNTSTDRNPVHVFDAVGCAMDSFDVRLTVSRNGCSDVITKSISIKESPELSLIDVDNPFDPFNNCSSVFSSPDYTITIDDTSPSTCVSNKRIDWGDGTTDANPTFPLSHTYTTTGAFNLRIIGDGDNGCTGERVYIVKNVSNPQGGLNSPGTTQNLCAPTPLLNFAISNWGENSADTQYTIDYGDGTPPAVYTQTELEASSFYNASNPGSSAPFPVPYSYLESNCPIPSYTVRLTIENACGFTDFTASNITVLSPPEAEFTAPLEACVNTPVTFTNLSGAGYGRDCNTDAIYTWDFGDGSPVITTAPSPPLNINHTYTAPGTYTVRLTAQGFCDDDTFERVICIEPPVVPQIAFSALEGCENLDVAITNTTDLSNFCSDVTYNWTVNYTDDFCTTGAGSYTFTNGTDASSPEPQFNFDQPGRYTIAGTITGSSCGTVAIPSQEILIKQPPRVTINPINSLCEGEGLTINPTALVESCTLSSSNLSYNWSFPGATTSSSTAENPGTITYTAQGDYTVSLTVTNECGITTATDVTFSISEDPVITGNLSECEGETEQLTATGNPASTRPWRSSNNDIARVTNTGLVRAISPGTVTITFTNDNGCTDTVSFEVRNGPTFTSQPIPNQELCVTAVPAPLTASFTNGSGTASYQWYENAIDSNAGGVAIAGATNPTYLPEGATVGERFYYLIVSFSEGCPTIVSNTARVLINPQPVINTQPIANQQFCIGATSDPLELNFSSGAGTATYQWYENTTDSTTGGTAIVGATGSNYTPPAFAAAGSYYYYAQVTFSAAGCTSITSEVAQIDVVEDPTVSIQPVESQEICQGAAATSLNVTAAGGAGTFSYQWYQSSSNSNTGGTLIPGATSNTFDPPSSIVGELYYYVVIQQPGLDCEVRSRTSSVKIVPSPIITSQPQSAEYCAGEPINTLSISTANGTGTPAFQWYENTDNSNTGGTAIAGAISANYTPPSSIETKYYYATASFTGGGCSVITSNVATITIDQGPVIGNERLTICNGELFDFIPESNSSNLIPASTLYSWTRNTMTPANSINGSTNQDIPQSSLIQQLENTTNAPAIIVYTVTPISGNCPGVPFTLEVEVLPTAVVEFDQTDQTICSNTLTTAVQLSSNFSQGVTLDWNASIPAGIDGAIATGTNVIPAQTLINTTNVPLTITYTGRAQFSNGAMSCPANTATYSITIQPEIQASGIVSDYNGFGVSASGASDGTINLTVTGGSSSYTFEWTGPNGFIASTKDITGLAAGVYVVVINDGVCAPVQLTFTITSPPNLQIGEDQASRINVTCYDGADGSLTVTINQASIGPYDYELIDSNNNVIDTSLSSSDLSQTFDGLTAGFYSVRITDANGASKIISSIEITQPTPIEIQLDVNQISCYLANDATIIATITGGSGSYTSTWSDLATGNIRNNLSAGNYTLTVMDQSGCTATATAVVEEPPVFFTAPSFTNISCPGANDGTIQLNLTGGVAPVNLVWSDGSTQGTTRNNLSAGIYTATITDATGCSIVESFTIIDPQPLALDVNVTPVLNCNNPNSGAIDLLVSGGTAPYSYAWSNGATSEDLIDITAGSYAVTVTDASGCSTTLKTQVTGTTPIKLQITDRLEIDCEAGVYNQFITATATGGVAPYSFRWSSGQDQISTEPSTGNSDTISTSLNGLVIVTVTDALGCQRDATFDVDLDDLEIPSFDSDSFGYFTYGDFSILDPIQFTNTSTGVPIAITWDFGDGAFSNELSPIHTYTSPGQYVVTQSVDYGYGCIQQSIITLEVTTGYKLIVPNAFTPNGDGLNDKFRPAQEGLEDLKFTVYDTWGSLIYSEEGSTISGWDGQINSRNAENGNFYYKLVGNTFYGTEVVSEGTFTKID